MAYLFSGTPIQYDLYRENRFITEFPENFGIKSWIVQSINLPKITKAGKEKYWENIKIEFISPISECIAEKLMKILNDDPTDFNIFIGETNPMGIVINRWEIEVKNVYAIDFGNHTYNHDKLLQPTIIFRVKNCKLIEPKEEE